jgi:hypothetical protein
MSGISAPRDAWWQGAEIHVSGKFVQFEKEQCYNVPWLGTPCFQCDFGEFIVTQVSFQASFLLI